MLLDRRFKLSTSNSFQSAIALSAVPIDQKLKDSQKPIEKPRLSSRSVFFYSVILLIIVTIIIIVEWARISPQTFKKYLRIDLSHFPELQSKSSHSSDGCIDYLPEDHFHKLHLVTPPEGPVHIVCCQTTKGAMNIAVHTTWAPLGCERFMEMVTTGFFDVKVPLFRALKSFLIQFGLAGDPKLQKPFNERDWLLDDPSWLPFGPAHRRHGDRYRYQKGYLGYAGAGKNSRGTQLILAFEKNEALGGGSPWEVPWGQLIGNQSYVTLSKIYTGYGETPSQGKIMNRGLEYTEKEFPLMDYMFNCRVMKKNLPWKYKGKIPLS